ncbi:hypothetical protein [Streptomyces lavendulae]|nr:hypothetical protein [Streptomyces lavendulae]GLX27334.1 hypothetical protein Slala02_31540 [Streptomyces lavendulae subsp. lavendulae]
MPPGAAAREDACEAGYGALKEFLTEVHVHLTARHTEQLGYRRLVALAQ